MSFQGGSRAAPAVLTPSQIKAPGDLSYARLDKANAPQHVFPNALINASFDHWQRGVGPFTASGAAFVYGPDRWSTYNIGANGQATVTRRALAFGDWPSQSRFSAIFGCSGHSAAGDGMVGRQLIEGVDTYAGRRVAVKGGIRLVTGAAGSKVALEMEQAFGTGGSADSVKFGPAAGQQQQITLTGVLTPFAAIFDVPSMSGKIIGTANDALALNIWLSAGSNFNTRTGNLGLQSIQIELVDVEVKEIKPGYGDAVPSFERLPKWLDLTLSQRYYITGLVFRCGQGGNAGNNTYTASYVGCSLFLPVPMRILATKSFTDLAGNPGKITMGGNHNQVVSAGGLFMDKLQAVYFDATTAQVSTSYWWHAIGTLDAEF